MSGAEQVFGAGTPPRPSSGAGGVSLGRMRLGRTQLMVGGAVLVAGLAFMASRKPGAQADAIADDSNAGGAYSDAGSMGGYNTSSTDLYNEIQPELEALNDALYQQSTALAEQNNNLASASAGLTTAVNAIPAAVAAALPKTPKPSPKKAKPKAKPKAHPQPKSQPKPKPGKKKKK